MADKFQYSSVKQMLAAASQEGFPLRYSFREKEVLSLPVTIGRSRVGNRLVAQPIEGFDSQADGSPSERSIERYCRLARGGFRVLWMESVSVDEQGRSNPYQLWIKPDNVEQFRQMVQKIRSQTDEKVYLVIQLTHSGRNSNPYGTPQAVCAFSNPCIPKENEYILRDDEIPQIVEDYVQSCRLAKEAGFDAVDIRTCHGYLLNEFLAAYNRPGKYGGSFENRTRFLMEILERVQKEVDIDIGVRLNMYDGLPYPYGWGADSSGENPEEAYRLISLLYEKGVRILNITSGIGAYSPFVIRPYDRGGIEPSETSFQSIYRMQEHARQVKKLAPNALVIASAFSWMREYGPGVAAAEIENGSYDMAGFGRLSICFPHMAEKILSGEGLQRKDCCVTCCGCTNLIKKNGKMLRCIIREEE